MFTYIFNVFGQSIDELLGFGTRQQLLNGGHKLSQHSYNILWNNQFAKELLEDTKQKLRSCSLPQKNNSFTNLLVFLTQKLEAGQLFGRFSQQLGDLVVLVARPFEVLVD